MADFPTKEVCFEVAGWSSKLFDTPTPQGHKYCITLFDSNDNRYRIYSYTRYPAMRFHGHKVSINNGDIIRAVATVSETPEGELLSLLFNTIELLDDFSKRG